MGCGLGSWGRNISLWASVAELFSFGGCIEAGFSDEVTANLGLILVEVSVGLYSEVMAGIGNLNPHNCRHTVSKKYSLFQSWYDFGAFSSSY